MWLFRADALTVWDYDEVRERLSWYRSVMLNEMPAKFLIADRVGSDAPLTDLSENELWEEHRRLAEKFQVLFSRVKESGSISDVPKPEKSYLDVKRELILRILRECRFCEWRCHVDRVSGEKGKCRVSSVARVSTWFSHFGEEAPLIGTGGSGTIFFAGCNFGPCVYCQNWDISSDPLNGVEVDGRKIAMIAKSLRKAGAANTNFVGGEPTPNLHVIVESMKYLDVNVPLLWNTNMYCSTEAMKILLDVIDIWLPDFKYGNDACAQRLSKVRNYTSAVERNLKLVSDSNGDMIIRHLVLPNHVECCSKPILKWISANAPRALVNIMAQYHPDYIVEMHPELYPDIARRPTRKEMSECFEYAKKHGICFEPVS